MSADLRGGHNDEVKKRKRRRGKRGTTTELEYTQIQNTKTTNIDPYTFV
jgi:hypothetical protein